MEIKEAYRTLGLSKGVSLEEIRKRYISLMKIHHPDVNKSADADKFSAIINDAYETLKKAFNEKIIEEEEKEPIFDKNDAKYKNPIYRELRVPIMCMLDFNKHAYQLIDDFLDFVKDTDIIICQENFEMWLDEEIKILTLAKKMGATKKELMAYYKKEETDLSFIKWLQKWYNSLVTPIAKFLNRTLYDLEREYNESWIAVLEKVSFLEWLSQKVVIYKIYNLTGITEKELRFKYWLYCENDDEEKLSFNDWAQKNMYSFNKKCTNNTNYNNMRYTKKM